MSRFMSAMWVIEVVVLLVAHVVCLVRPSAVFYLLEECDTVRDTCTCCTSPGPGVTPPPAGAEAGPCSTSCCVPRGLCTDPTTCCSAHPANASDTACDDYARCPSCAQILETGRKACLIIAKDREAQGLFAFARMLAPFLLTFGLLAAHAAMREDEALRRNFSFIFAWVYLIIAALVATDDFSDQLERSDFYVRALFAALCTGVLFSIFEALRAPDRIQRSISLVAAAAYAAVALADQRSNDFSTVLHVAVALSVIDTLIGGFERLRGRLFALGIGWPVVMIATDPLGQMLFGDRLPANDPATMFIATIRDRRPATQVLLAFVTFAVVVHAIYAVWPADPQARRLSGTANTRPSSLWVLWLLQGLLFLFCAALLVVTHRDGVAGMLTSLQDSPGYLRLFEEMKNLFPALLVAMALLSFTGMQSSREWVWKALCAIFCVFYVALFLDLLLIWTSALFSDWLIGVLVPMVVLFAMHARYLVGHDDWFSEEVGEGPDGWIPTDLVMGPYLMYRTLLTGRRPMWCSGVAAWGKLRVLPQGPRPYPDHDFFVPGATLDVKVRFANERSEDDAAVDARGAAISMTRADGRRFDLLLSTGAYSSARNVVEQGIVTFANALGRPGRRWLARRRPYLEGGLAALRRAPESYTRLIYHAQTVRFWVATNDERYLVRYRLVPCVDGPSSAPSSSAGPPVAELRVPAKPALLLDDESGLPVTAADFVDRDRRPDDHRPPDYLRSELKGRLEGKLAQRFVLQAQLHPVSVGDGDAWYNPAADWKTTATEQPYVDLAEIVLEDVLSDEEGEKLCVDPDQAPQSLGTPVARGAFDYRSIAASERRVVRRIESLRAWRIQAFGMPARIIKLG